MDFYLSIDGEKQGPFGIVKVAELIESGRVDRDSLGWHREQEGWKPLHEIPALDPVLPEEEAASETPDSPDFTSDGGGASGTVSPDIERGASEASAELPADLRAEGPKSVAPGAPPLASVDDERARPRPLRRFWARMFDYTLVSVVVFLFAGFSFPEPGPDDTFSDLFAEYLETMQSEEARTLARTQFFALIGWHLLEAVLIHLVGTTPGKALFGITVLTRDRYRIPLARSLGRTIFVYILGVGFYLFPFNILGMLFSFFRIMTTGQCLWDQQLGLIVESKKLSTVRIILAIAAFFVLLLLQSAKLS